MRTAPPKALARLGAAVLGVAAAILLAVPATAADRDPILFQPVVDKDGTFQGVGTGPFTTKYPDGVKDDGKTVARSKVVADNFDKAYTWGTSGSDGGMVIKNISGKPICSITIKTLNDSLFPKDAKVYQAPEGWTATVSEDGRTLTFAAIKKPDNCVPSGGWFWMKVPASPKPTAEGGATLNGQLAIALPYLDGTSGDALAALAVVDETVGTDPILWPATSVGIPT